MARHPWDPRCPAPRGLVAPVLLDPSGTVGPTRGQARGPSWRAVARGWYVAASAPDLPEQRILEQAVRLPPGGAVTGWAACRLHGGGFFDGLAPDGRTRLPVPLAVGCTSGTRPAPDVVISRDRLDPGEVVVVHGVPCTTAERAVFDAVRGAPDLRMAVVALDMAAAGEITSLARMRRYLAVRRGWGGVVQAREALDLASERSRSPAETRMRLLWLLDAGLPPPRSNWPVHSEDGRRLAVVDLLDVEAGVVGEYDGADHRAGARHTRDVRREDALRRAGLEYFTITARDLWQPALVVDRMRSTRTRARLSGQPRRWLAGSIDHEVSLDHLLDQREVARFQRF